MSEAHGNDESTGLLFTNDVDWHLRMLVENANDFGLEVPITLFVAGAVLSGVLTSGKVYFDLFAERFAAGWPGEGQAQIRASMASPGAVYPRLKPGEKSQRKQPAQFIHLRDARVISGQRHYPQTPDGLLWRGRLAAVGGYSLGRLSDSVAGKKSKPQRRSDDRPQPTQKRRSEDRPEPSQRTSSKSRN
jgi:hypothetical protein